MRTVALLPFIASKNTDRVLPQCSPTLPKKGNSLERKLSQKTLRNYDIDSEV